MSSHGVTTRKTRVSAEDLRRLLGRLDADPARAWEVYGHLRLALLKYFEHNYCPEPDQLADETLDRIARKPDEQEIANVLEYAFGVARHVRRETDRKTALRKDLTEVIRDAEVANQEQDPESTIVKQIDRERKLECLRRCISALTPYERELLYLYHPDDCEQLDEHRQRVAQEFGLSWATLRTRMSRIRQKLEQCFERAQTKE
jgi:RNA polymerase sigma factor (sigma-70 family)